MRLWMRCALAFGYLIITVLVLLPPHGLYRPGGEIVCAPLLGGEAPSLRLSYHGDQWTDVWEPLEGWEDYDHDVEQLQITAICDQRRSVRLTWLVLIAIPTSALTGAWVSARFSARHTG
ncbi:hypothetical protein NOSIN_00020 [Nocardiopsis sinuspersici]|uniref:Uncharacterized protein n=2 Tax=Nocardiopsidaceae TaxID=83676 RepID=A0A1V3BV89_9ACTN|nr:hypothetical protein NOSIN_00020 [Nocardiopsis sinuspersici]